MPVQRFNEKWSHKVNVLTLGATKAEGGTRSRSVKVGGQNTLPFLLDEGDMPNPPIVAAEIYDGDPGEEFPAPFRAAWGDAVKDPATWAKKAEETGAEAVALMLKAAHPDNRNTPVAEVVQIVKAVKAATGLPLIVWGTGSAEKDNEIVPPVAQALKGEKAIFASATQDNYKRIAAACIADGHSVVSESPLDINICKQVNILLTEMDFPPDRIALYPTNGALGYGFEYGYSIMERTRLAALGGDKMMAMPIIAVVGSECVRAKEVKAPEADFPAWGGHEQRASGWEVASAVGYLMAGADVITLGLPKSIEKVQGYIKLMMKK